MKKNILIFILSGIFFSTISVFATLSYSSSQITYKNTTLDHAIDDLYTAANKEEYSGQTSFTPSSSTQTISTNNKLLKSDLTINPIPSKYKDMETFTMRETAFSFNTTAGVGEITLSNYLPFFKYFKVSSIVKETENTDQCYARSWSGVSLSFDNIVINNTYEILSNTDNKNYGSIQVVTKSKNTNSARCQATIMFFN